MGFHQFVGKIPGVMPVTSLFYSAIDKDTPKGVRFFGLFALFYLAFPVDLIPDVLLIIMGIGALDDIAVLYMAYKFAQSHILPKQSPTSAGFLSYNRRRLSSYKGLVAVFLNERPSSSHID